jgi:hypothetical protein
MFVSPTEMRFKKDTGLKRWVKMKYDKDAPERKHTIIDDAIDF